MYFFKLRYIYCFFRHDALYCILHRLQSGVNTAFVCTGKPKKVRDSLYCHFRFIAVVWTQTCSISEVREWLLKEDTLDELCEPGPLTLGR